MNDLTCVTARELMLDAEPSELHARGDSPLARHLRACADCARAASAILAMTDDLAHALDTLAAAPAAKPRADRSKLRRLTIALAPLAAAALVLIVLWQRNQEPALEPIVLPVQDVPTVPVVNVPAGGTVAVMRASNPNITIVWNLES
jgi:anti-sigma factor RsiW